MGTLPQTASSPQPGEGAQKRGEREEVVTRRRERTDAQRQEAGCQALTGSDPRPAFSLLPEPRHPGAQRELA